MLMLMLMLHACAQDMDLPSASDSESDDERHHGFVAEELPEGHLEAKVKVRREQRPLYAVWVMMIGGRRCSGGMETGHFQASGLCKDELYAQMSHKERKKSNERTRKLQEAAGRAKAGARCARYQIA